MKRRCWRRLEVACLGAVFLPIALASTMAAETPSAEQLQRLRYPAYVTRYDLATPDDLLYCRMLETLVLGDEPAKWGVLNGVAAQVGNWINGWLDAKRIASIITTGMAIEGQPPLRSVDEIITDCAKVLRIDKPTVYVRNSPLPTAYAAQIHGRGYVVLTSGLLTLFEGRPDELRFVVGHELGHLKCNHIPIQKASFGILRAIQGINRAVIPDTAQILLPTLALGRLCSWSREAEISADRAGLLCCQDEKVAYQALLRLLHGLKADSAWVDPDSPDFEPDVVVRNFQRWQDQPFVDFIIDIQRYAAEAPFIPERLAALKLWAETPAFREILERTSPINQNQLVVFEQIEILGLGGVGDSITPYIIVHDEKEALFRTQNATNLNSPRWPGLKYALRLTDGQPFYFEIWNSRLTRDEFLGGFVIYPRRGTEAYTTSVLWDWKERSNTSRLARVEVKVSFRDRQ